MSVKISDGGNSWHAPTAKPAQPAPQGSISVPQMSQQQYQQAYQPPRSIVSSQADSITPIGGGGGGGGFAPNPAPTPVQQYTPPAPPTGGQQWYKSQAPAIQQLTDEQYLAGDSDYQAQIGEYNRALQAFMSRIADQKKNYDEDARLAGVATDKNNNLGLVNNGEDFAARGLAYSGLFDNQRNQINDRFNDQRANIKQVQSRNNTQADNQLSDYQGQNTVDQGNAKRAALLRQAQQQSIIDQTAGF